MFLLDDPQTDAPALPHTYGVDDIPVIVQDKRFNGATLDRAESSLSGTGILGDTIAVNGTVAPYLAVTTERVRLRLLNASNARVYSFGFTDERAFALVGTDGGLLPRPYQMSHLMLSPGERAEIIVTVRPSERPVLRSSPPDLGLDPLSNRFTGGADTLDILQLRAAATLAASAPTPASLVDVPRLDPASAVQTRQFLLGDTRINGQQMDPSRVDLTVAKDTVELWDVVNNDGTPHNFHIHDVQFQVHTLDGAPPPPERSGWKDTVYMRPHARYEFILRFADYADPGTPYMYHCHLLRHEDHGMMGQFVVVNPGESATPIPNHH
jgi:FtsP/CotA-like multicopper oxidase with cupredoxin domain